MRHAEVMICKRGQSVSVRGKTDRVWKNRGRFLPSRFLQIQRKAKGQAQPSEEGAVRQTTGGDSFKGQKCLDHRGPNCAPVLDTETLRSWFMSSRRPFPCCSSFPARMLPLFSTIFALHAGVLRLVCLHAGTLAQYLLKRARSTAACQTLSARRWPHELYT